MEASSKPESVDFDVVIYYLVNLFFFYYPMQLYFNFQSIWALVLGLVVLVLAKCVFDVTI